MAPSSSAAPWTIGDEEPDLELERLLSVSPQALLVSEVFDACTLASALKVLCVREVATVEARKHSDAFPSANGVPQLGEDVTESPFGDDGMESPVEDPEFAPSLRGRGDTSPNFLSSDSASPMSCGGSSKPFYLHETQTAWFTLLELGFVTQYCHRVQQYWLIQIDLLFCISRITHSGYSRFMAG